MITTKTGDQGQTTCGNMRVDKDDVLVEVIGTVDELMAVLGIVKLKVKNEKLKVEGIQKDLMAISGELACDIKYKKTENRVKELEKEIELMENKLPKMMAFEIPGETEAEAMTHFCRTIARRAERRLVSLNKVKKIDEEILKYFNRLSDYLFLVARLYKGNGEVNKTN